ncbi:MAG TPA: hypothetical protein VGK22_19880 [Candidatus Angelobacter sp.]
MNISVLIGGVFLMKHEFILAARKAAELAVEDMASGPLKTVAFQTILAQLLQRETTSPNVEPALSQVGNTLARKKKGSGLRANGTTSRLIALIEEGIFGQQRSLTEIRQLLSERGWHYQLEDLGTPVTRLVRRKLLRRTQVSDSGKKIWKYTNA